MAKHRDGASARDEPRVRKGQGSVALSKSEFAARFKHRFYDGAFDAISSELDRACEIAWDAYQNARKSPRTQRAGSEFSDPQYELSVEWLETRRRLQAAQRRQESREAPSRILLVCGSSRSDQTCPAEMSKTFRLVSIAKEVVEERNGFEADLLDLSHLASEYGRSIHPCKACVSTAMPLCHWPCSCYPNHALGQSNDWMGEIYERWVAAHGVLIVTPVYWYGVPCGLKLMIDRLVCADGGNPDPTSTGGKDPAKAKALELAGWPYPKHLAGRAFAVVVHGDVEGVENVRAALTDWLSWMELEQAGHSAAVGRYVGYWQPYATSHEALDRDTAFQEETRNAARSLVAAVSQIRSGQRRRPDHELRPPRQK